MYVITGASGNTGSIIASELLAAGHTVKVIGRNAEKLANLTEKGAIPAIGDLQDEAFLAKEFKGAKAVYALIPPKWDLQEPWRNFQRKVAVAIANALQVNNVPYVVALSSMGSHMQQGAGPVSGLFDFEALLGGVKGLNVLALRAGFFFENFYGQLPLVKNAGIIGYSLDASTKTPMVSTRDIAKVAAQRLLALDFQGFEKEFVSGDRDYTMQEAASILGGKIGKPDLKYVQFSQEDAKEGMVSNGIPETIADGYNELFQALDKGEYLADFQRTSENTTPTSLEGFAKDFALAYQQA